VWPRKKATRDLEIDVVRTKLPAWPRDLQCIRKEVFPEHFVRSPPPGQAARRAVLATVIIDRRIVGFALAYVLPGEIFDRSHNSGNLEEVAVLPKHQRRHIGTDLAEAVIQELGRWNCDQVTACPLVGPDEESRRRWLRSLGFVPDDIGQGLTLVIRDHTSS
jgi:GNAT superfamily N-acetyltransferase